MSQEGVCIPRELAAVPAGGRVALVAPASPPRPENVERAVALLRGWGYEPVLGRHLLERHPDLPYLAGTDAQRAEDFVQALTDTDVDAVMCVRGGYGSARMLALVDPAVVRGAPAKPFFGSSDITAIHTWFADCCGRASWFSPMPATDAVLDDAASREGLQRALQNGLAKAGVEDRSGLPQRSASAGTVVTGRIRGGNLSLLAEGCLPGRRMGFDEPVIALLEDVDEPAYHIDYMCRRLVDFGWFRGVVGIALGSWLDCGRQPVVDAVVDDALRELDIPVASGFSFGHGPGAATLPLDVQGSLEICADGAVLRCGIDVDPR